MVKSFADAAFSNAKNEVSIAISEFGIHVVQTTNRSKLSKQVQVASLTRNVIPSTRTYQDTYAQASKFAGENNTKKEFDEAVTEQNLSKKIATVGENDRQIVGLENARNLIRAAYETEEGDIIISQQESPIFELGDNYVIAVLTEVTEEGIASFEDVKARVELSVLNEKKAEYLVEKLNNALEENSDLEAIATNLENFCPKILQILTLILFNYRELVWNHQFMGTASSLKVDQISKPVAGNNGVFLIQVTSTNQLANQDVASEQSILTQNLFYRATSQAYETHRESVEIIDKRSKFF